MSDNNASNAMWGGRFASGPAAIMEAINASIGFDRKLYAQDIRGSIGAFAKCWPQRASFRPPIKRKSLTG